MIRGSFSGITLIAEGNLKSIAQEQQQQQQQKKKSETPSDMLFEKLRITFNDNYIPAVQFPNKKVLENFVIGGRDNQGIDFSEIEKVGTRLAGYKNLLSNGNEMTKEELLLFSVIKS